MVNIAPRVPFFSVSRKKESLVLEGSVQRAGHRIRVNAQLIDARTDAHFWAQVYDRDVADVFVIQTEIAKTIADQLQAKLSPSERAAISRAATMDRRQGRWEESVRNWERGISLDPRNFRYLEEAGFTYQVLRARAKIVGQPLRLPRDWQGHEGRRGARPPK